jgi:hypothetical protein
MSDDVEALANRYQDYFAPRLRDVLPAIFAQLLDEDQRSFLSALCVCREWAAFGIRLRWRRASLGSLAHVADVSRRQLCADSCTPTASRNSKCGATVT